MAERIPDMVNEIYRLLEERVEEIFLIFQAMAGIDSGDVQPLDALLLKQRQGELSEVIGTILRKQGGM